MWMPITSIVLLLFAVTSHVNAADNEIKMGSCGYSSNPDVELTHVKYIITDTKGKIVRLTTCASHAGQFTPCEEEGSETRGHTYLFLSVRQKTSRLVNDIEYQYNEEMMKMSTLPDPRTMYTSNERFNDHGLLNLKSFNLGGNYYDSCTSSNQALNIAEHGLYIVDGAISASNFRYQKIYYEPMETGEYITNF